MKEINDDFGEDAKNFYMSQYNNRITYEDNKYFFDHNGKKIEVKGDICFNIKLGNGSDCIGSIIKKCDTEKEEYPIINQFTKSILNFSIMPTTGGLNNIKFAVGNDRFDTYIWALDMYYHGFNSLILNNGSKKMGYTNRNLLADFLDSYENIYDYCNDLYGIGDDLVSKMIVSGSMAIVNKEGLQSYIKLATQFWKERYDKLDEDNEKKYCANYDDLNNEIINEINKIIQSQ